LSFADIGVFTRLLEGSESVSGEELRFFGEGVFAAAG